jgi:hypothetical protein
MIARAIAPAPCQPPATLNEIVLGESAPSKRKRRRGKYFVAAREADALDSLADAAAAMPSPVETSDGVVAVLLAQEADGTFLVPSNVFGPAPADAKHWLDATRRALLGWLGETASADDALINTVGAMLLLRTKFAGDQDLWGRADRKAMRWVADRVARELPDVEKWIQAAVNAPEFTSTVTS